MMTTQNFAYDLAVDAFVTGVHYGDTDNNDFYSIGEGQGGRNVSVFSGATLLGTSTTAAAGGCGIEITKAGMVEVVFSGGGLAANRSVFITLGDINAKVDLVDSNTIETNFTSTLGQGAAGLKLIGIENINGTGNGLDNVITGNSGNNILSGGNGGDTLIGGNGNDSLIGGAGADTLTGGSGTDKAVFPGAAADYVIGYVQVTGVFTLRAADITVDTVSGVESFEFADQTISAATLQTLAVTQKTVSASASTASVSEGNLGTKSVTFTVQMSSAALTAQSVSYAIAGSGASPTGVGDIQGTLSGTLTFAAGETTKTITVEIIGDKVAENDEAFTLTLANPSAQLMLDAASASIIISNDDVAPVLFTGKVSDDTIIGTQGYDIIQGLAGNDIFKAGLGGDEVSGGDGNDLVDGGTGSDVMSGGVGNDTYLVDCLQDQVSEAGASGNDTVLSSIGFSLSSSQITGAVENITLIGNLSIAVHGNDVDNLLTGNGGRNVLTGLGGNDRLDGGRGADVMAGGTGNDTYIVDHVADVVDETGGNGIDAVLATVSINLLDGQRVKGTVENVTLLGLAKINVNGSNGDNQITGNGANNLLQGQGGNDTLNGGAGADVLTGGSGNDTLTGGAGVDRFHFDIADFGTDVVTDFADGEDFLSFHSSFADNISDLVITGNGTAHVVVASNGDQVTVNGSSPIVIDSTDLVFI